VHSHVKLITKSINLFYQSYCLVYVFKLSYNFYIIIILFLFKIYNKFINFTCWSMTDIRVFLSMSDNHLFRVSFIFISDKYLSKFLCEWQIFIQFFYVSMTNIYPVIFLYLSTISICHVIFFVLVRTICQVYFLCIRTNIHHISLLYLLAGRREIAKYLSYQWRRSNDLRK